MKLNLGSGLSKLEGFINIDIDPSLDPDEVKDFRQGLSQKAESVDEVVLYHTLEHLPKLCWNGVFGEIYRVLVPQGKFYISFPEWSECVKRYQDNYQGIKDFWEATLYGRQFSPSDFHVAICERNLIKRTLIQCGFAIDYCGPEPDRDYNSLLKCHKEIRTTYEETVWKT